ncbi:MAG: M50 family metallopeptidase [Sciscionella sp.]
MLSYVVGIVLFALGIGISVAIHEAAHLGTAKIFGMKVRRYFIGFGRKIWSFRRGETEYGLKLIPAGGFCDIAGMTALDELAPDEHSRAMWRYPTWKRFVVMASGSVSHFVIGFIVLYLMAVTMGLPNVTNKSVVADIAPCAQSVSSYTRTRVEYAPCTPSTPSPARDAGLRAGDRIVAVAGKPTSTWTDVTSTVQPLRGPTTVVVERNGERRTLTVDIAPVRSVVQQPGSRKQQFAETGALGVLIARQFHYNVLTGIGGAGQFTGQLFVNVWEGIKRLPEKVPALLKAIAGGQRDRDTPMSVVGASRIGGEAVQAGLWQLFWLFLALVNFALGVFNLLPLLPLDGGHIAVAFYERIRDWLRKLRGKAAGGPVDYAKLAPLTMIVVLIGGAYMIVAVLADIVNPITLLH